MDNPLFIVEYLLRSNNPFNSFEIECTSFIECFLVAPLASCSTSKLPLRPEPEPEAAKVFITNFSLFAKIYVFK